MKPWGWLLLCTLIATGIWLGFFKPKEPTKPDTNPTVMTNQVTAIIANDQQLFLGLGNGVIQIWDIDQGIKTDEFVAHDGGIRSLLIDDGLLVSVGMKGSVARWKNGTLVERFRLTDSHLNAAITTQDSTIIVAGARGQIAKLGTQDPWHLKGIHGRAVFDLAQSDDGQRLFSVGTDGRINRWNPNTGASIDGWSVGKHWLHTIQYRNGLLWTGDETGNVVVIDDSNGQEHLRLRLSDDRLISSTNAGELIAFGTAKGQVHLVNTRTRTRTSSLTVMDGPVLGLWMSGQRLIVGGRGTTVRIYDDYGRDSPRELDVGGK